MGCFVISTININIRSSLRITFKILLLTEYSFEVSCHFSFFAMWLHRIERIHIGAFICMCINKYPCILTSNVALTYVTLHLSLMSE